jgi:RimJ/RimL family protein N-acetyltransferase
MTGEPLLIKAEFKYPKPYDHLSGREYFSNGILSLGIFAEPRSGVVQHIIIAVLHHAFRAKVNQHAAFNMADNQKSWRILIAAKASVQNIIFMKTIAFLVVVFHRN